MEQIVTNQNKPNRKRRDYAKVESIGANEIVQALRSTDFNRGQIYSIIKVMLKDPTTISILNSMIEDFTKPFEGGRRIRAISNKETVQNYINELLDAFNANAMCPEQMLTGLAYGELIGRLYTIGGMYKKKHTFNTKPTDEDLISLKAAVDKIANSNRYIKRIEHIDNPLEYYDVQFMKEPLFYINQKMKEESFMNAGNSGLLTFGSDVFKFSTDLIVHKILYPNIVKERYSSGLYDGEGELCEYIVEKGKGLLEAAYPAFVDLKLAEAAIKMSREAKAVVVTLVQIQCQDMTDEEADETTDSILEKLTVRRTLNSTEGISEYTNSQVAPSVIVTSMKGETGEIKVEQVGGDYDPGSLNDIEYLENVYFGAFRTIKQKFGRTKDAAGFSGGESLVELKSSYASMGTTAQTMIIDFWTDVLNRYLDRCGYLDYVGNFELQMMKMVTQEEIDKAENKNRSIQMAEQAMLALKEQELPELKVFRAMINQADITGDLVELIDEMIAKLEEPQKEDEDEDDNEQDFDEDFDEDFEQEEDGGEDLLEGLADGVQNDQSEEYTGAETNKESGVEKKEPSRKTQNNKDDRLPDFGSVLDKAEKENT